MLKFSWLQCRHVLIALVSSGLFNVYTMRVNLGVAIVAMVKKTKKNLTDSETCPVIMNITNGTSIQEGEFAWTEYQQGIILGSFFYIYIVTNFLGGRIAEKCGVKWTFGIGILSTSILTLFTPLCARWGYVPMIVLRIAMGTMEGVTFPAIHCLTGRWYSKTERGSAYTIMFSGSTVGSIVGMVLSGVLCHSDFLGGWPSVFYVFGGIGLIWCVIWFLLMHEYPENHPRISDQELQFIQNAKAEEPENKDVSIPWLQIFLSVPVWVVALVAFGRNWIHNITLFTIPTYLKTILHYNIEESGFISSLPSIVEAVITMAGGYLSDWILKKRYMSVSVTRKLLNTLGLVLSAICCVIVVFMGCDRTAIVTLLTISTGISGLCIAGFMVAIVDMSPTFAGTLMGVTNAFGQTSGILAPFTVGVLTDNNQTRGQWEIVFYVTAAISVFTALAFAIFGSVAIQSWSQMEPTPKQFDENSKIYYVNKTVNTSEN